MLFIPPKKCLEYCLCTAVFTSDFNPPYYVVQLSTKEMLEVMFSALHHMTDQLINWGRIIGILISKECNMQVASCQYIGPPGLRHRPV